MKKKNSILLSSLLIAGTFLLPTSVKADTTQPIKPVKTHPLKTVVSYHFSSSSYGTITGDGVRVRSQPNTHSTILGLLYRNDSVDINKHHITKDFISIDYNGRVAYVSSRYVDIF